MGTKPREFFVWLRTPDGPFFAYKTLPEVFTETDPELIKVRETSPALDAAYAECEKALEWEKKRCGGLHGPLGKALAALRKAWE